MARSGLSRVRLGGVGELLLRVRPSRKAARNLVWKKRIPPLKAVHKPQPLQGSVPEVPAAAR